MTSPPRVYEITFTVPAGTAIATPVGTPWVTEDNTIVDIELEVPPGHNGLTGIRVMKGDTQLIPWGQDTWIIANDYNRVFPVGAYLPTGDVTLEGYNTGSYDHSFYLRMTVVDYSQDTGTAVPSSPVELPAGSITSSPDPLSPDAILGPDTAAALANGDITASDVTPVIDANLTVPQEPVPTGLG
jgi:hypothetical protein